MTEREIRIKNDSDTSISIRPCDDGASVILLKGFSVTNKGDSPLAVYVHGVAEAVAMLQPGESFSRRPD